MMVVIGVIAFLMTLLLPALVRAKEIAKKVYCINNLNQTVKIASMYNLDYGSTPYSSIWLIDFAFMAKYIDSAKYGVMECPDTDDVVESACALTGATSYHYMGSRSDWETCNTKSGDGSTYGFDAGNPEILSKLSSREEKIIYDKSDTVHYGHFNYVYIDSGNSGSDSWANRGKYWFVTAPSTLNFDGTDYPDRSHNLNEERYAGKFVSAGNSGTDEPGGIEEPEDPNKGKQPWKVRIIHYPPGKPGNEQELCVGYSAWPAHQAHGDLLIEIIYK